jgi:hypothetical protein
MAWLPHLGQGNDLLWIDMAHFSRSGWVPQSTPKLALRRAGNAGLGEGVGERLYEQETKPSFIVGRPPRRMGESRRR